ncbi:MAG: ABC transporter permease [Candidatus Planktophila sp.]|jgi:ribose transport system permease protein
MAVFILGSLTTDRFFSTGNFRNLVLQLAVVAILALGSALIILTGEIDLSSGALVSLLSMVLATLIMPLGLPLPVGLGVVLFTGIFCGLLNGILVTYLRVPSFVATLGTLGIFQGIALLFNGGSPISGLGENVQTLFYGRVLGVQYPLFYMVIVLVSLRFFLIKTVTGRSIYAVGGNRTAASLTGLKSNQIRLIAFGISGLLTAMAAILFTARLAAGSPNLGNGLELSAIAAAVVGGISLAGGRGDVLGAIFGTITIVFVQNILNLNAVPPTWQSITQGLIIIAAVSVDSWRGNSVFTRKTKVMPK